MKSFLEYIAADLLAKYGTDLSRIAVVFPNKRASLFLNEHLARMAGKPLWSPRYITISDLFRSHAQLKVADPIKLVCELHRCFTQCTGIDETLDHFYGWGQLLLSDFDDLDKNMAPADKVFANLRDIHELDDISYLTPEQREILKRFFSNFSDDHNTELKQRFLRLWSHIGDIYKTFNERLASQQLTYEGALYRQVATDEHLTLDHDLYIFVGFNMLQQVEQTLFQRLKKEGRARFYWDFDEYYLGQSESQRSEAGHYIAQYLSDFPNELDIRDKDIYANFSREKQITYISAPTENIQARYLSEWLDEERIKAGRKTAVVLCNEGLLQTVVHCLPEQVEKVNVTTGYPLSQTPVATLVSLLFNLHIFGRSKLSGQYQTRRLNAVLRHPYARFFSLDTLSEPILPWLRDTIRQIAVSIEQPDALTQESLFRMYTLLNRLTALVESGDLTVDIITMQRLVAQIVSATTIPFHGEPAEGLQVMGVLETRNIDFDHVILLSCNEGNMPRGVSDTSFIPYSIRKAYGLTTIDHKVAIYAYYFHRLLQRASDITLVYCNATADGQTGEMSRFMLQLMVESGQHIRLQTLQAGQQPRLRQPQPIAKTDAVMQLLRKRFDLAENPPSNPQRPAPLLTPTAINRYMRCQLLFFYHYACGLIEPDDPDDDGIDNRVFGNIFHEAAENIYRRLMQKSPHIVADDIDQLLKTEVDIRRAVDDAMKRELFKIKDPSRPLPPLDGLQLINREVIIRYIRLLLEVDRRLTPFTILGLEKDAAMTYDIPGQFTTVIGGRMDRLDQITDADGTERIRVIDYKTGAKRLKALADTEAIFAPESLKDHSDYFLQAFLYSHIVRQESALPVSPALLFIQHAGGDDYDPTLCLGKDKQPVRDIAKESDRFMSLLDDTIAEIFNPAAHFLPTDDRNRCKHCPYLSLCGRTVHLTFGSS